MTDRPLITVATLVAPLVMTRFGGAFGVHAFIHSAARRVQSVELTLAQGDTRFAARDVILVGGMLDAYLSSSLEPDYAAGLDGGFFISAVLEPDVGLRDGLAAIETKLRWDDGVESELRLCYAQVQRVAPVAAPHGIGAGGALVGIAMATYNPDPALFARQIESIRAQTHESWICVVSDDHSSPRMIANIKEAIKGDPRFVLLPGGVQLGFYRNFERALAALPQGCSHLAFSDQDDVWKPDRLRAGLAVLSGENAECTYSDMEVVHSSGRKLSHSFWVHRHPGYGSLSGLMMANVVTGMAMTFVSSLRQVVLPFPATPNLTYHDAWIALVAEGRGSLRYLPDALVEYVQHGGNHTGALTPPSPARLSLRCGMRRLAELILVPLRRRRDPERVKALLADLSYWGDREPARMRLLAESLGRRMPDLRRKGNFHGLQRVCRGFGPIAVLRAGAGWKDRYRRTVATELVIAGLTRRIVLAYASRVRMRSR